MNKNKEKPVPFYTKAGWVAAWIVTLVIVAMIMRNCATSVIYGKKTEQEKVDKSYFLGEKAGRGGMEPQKKSIEMENPVLRKAYNKGYRDGLDVYKLEQEKNKGTQ